MGFPVDGNAFLCEPTEEEEEEEEERGGEGEGGGRGRKGKKEGRISQSNFYISKSQTTVSAKARNCPSSSSSIGFLSIFNVPFLGCDKETTEVLE